MPNKLPVWVVYKKPSDYPEKYVARLFLSEQATDEIKIADDLKTLRDMLPEGLYRLPRQQGDDPVILETWL